ncbi:MAG TPA: hemerythrin domain-containing protein [Burkholderiales bacterium]|nr:hemerythrin domain-containing protein [Burkholderiales bacterium]
MTNPVVAWHEEHAYFRRLLGLLRKELDVFHGGERPNYELMVEVVSYLRDYGDQVHHRREDEAFARLASRVPELELPLVRLQQEHRVIAHAGETLLERINAILEGAIVPREEVEMILATYLVYYDSHIAREEDSVLPRAERALGEEDWRAVKDAAPEAQDTDYASLRRRIAQQT